MEPGRVDAAALRIFPTVDTDAFIRYNGAIQGKEGTVELMRIRN